MNETKADKIHDLEVEISGYCDAAGIIILTALNDLKQLAEIKAMPSIAAETIKGEIESVQFMIFQIEKAALAISEIVDPGHKPTEDYAGTPGDIKRAIGTPSLLKAARLEKGYTEDQLAELAGVTPDAIRAYETGDRVPRDEIKVTLSEILERPVEELFF